jgi:hypothetical protein
MQFSLLQWACPPFSYPWSSIHRFLAARNGDRWTSPIAFSRVRCPWRKDNFDEGLLEIGLLYLLLTVARTLAAAETLS